MAKAPGGRLGLEGIQLPDAEAWAGGRRGPSMAVPSPGCALSRKDCVLRGRGLGCGAVARGPRVGCEAAALGSQTVHSRGGIGLPGQSPDLGTMEGGGAGVIPETCSKGSPSTRCTVGMGRPAWSSPGALHCGTLGGHGRQGAALSGAPGERTAWGREGASCRSLRSGVQGHLWPHTGLGWGRQRRATHSLRQCWLWRKQRPAAPRLQIPALRRNRGRAPGGLESFRGCHLLWGPFSLTKGRHSHLPGGVPMLSFVRRAESGARGLNSSAQGRRHLQPSPTGR